MELEPVGVNDRRNVVANIEKKGKQFWTHYQHSHFRFALCSFLFHLQLEVNCICTTSSQIIEYSECFFLNNIDLNKRITSINDQAEL